MSEPATNQRSQKSAILCPKLGTTYFYAIMTHGACFEATVNHIFALTSAAHFLHITSSLFL
jgi:hypothetical protein